MGISWSWSWIVEDSEKEGSWKRKWLNRSPWTEGILSWMLCISCLSVSGYNYYSMQMSRWNKRKEMRPPLLMTHSYEEFHQYTFSERCQQFSNCIQQHLQSNNNNDDDWIQHLCTNETSRRLASILMKQYHDLQQQQHSSKTHHQWNPRQKEIMDTLQRIWNSLLQLQQQQLLRHNMPTTIVENEKTKISLIIPLYRESVSNVQHTVQTAIQRSSSSSFLEIILVHAITTANDEEDIAMKKTFQQQQETNNHMIKYVEYKNGGGRGPSLNYGAKVASGHIYTFCHADTILPHDWDYHIQTALCSKKYKKKANACAFSFGISKPTTTTTTIPGIAAVECTANIRTQLFSLPYGDQTISLLANFFHSIGGFPDQCLFEDYELISLLRQRQFYFHNNNNNNNNEEEQLVILPQKIYCSPRRWQKYGVLYVTFMNSKFVNYYVHSNMSPNDLYCLYYQTPHPPQRT